MGFRISVLSLCVSLLFATLGNAHGNEEHVMGTVTNVSENSITVKTRSNDTVTVHVVPETEFLKSGAKAKITDLKVGDRVVIHTRKVGDKLQAHTVRFGGSSHQHRAAENSGGNR